MQNNNDELSRLESKIREFLPNVEQGKFCLYTAETGNDAFHILRVFNSAMNKSCLDSMVEYDKETGKAMFSRAKKDTFTRILCLEHYAPEIIDCLENNREFNLYDPKTVPFERGRK